MPARAIQADTCHFFHALEKKCNCTVGFVATHTFPWIGQIQTADHDNTTVKIGKIFIAFLSVVTILPLVGLFIVAWSARLLRSHPPARVQRDPAPPLAPLPVQPPEPNRAPQPAAFQELNGANRRGDFIEREINGMPQPPVPEPQLAVQGAPLVLQIAPEPLHPIDQLDIWNLNDLPTFVGYLDDPLPKVRAHVAQEVALLALKEERTTYVAIRNSRVIPKLIERLNDPSWDVQKEAVHAICNLSLRHQDEILEAKGIEALEGLLFSVRDTEHPFLWDVIGALKALAEPDSPTRDAIGKTKVIGKLLEFSSIDQLRREAVAALFYIVKGNEMNKAQVRKNEFILRLLELLDDADCDEAIQFIGELGDNSMSCDAFREKGAIPPLARLATDVAKEETRSHAIWTLGRLAIDNPVNQNLIRVTGVFKDIIALLEKGNITAKEQQVLVIGYLVDKNRDNQIAFLELGVLPILFDLLKREPFLRFSIFPALVSLTRENRDVQDAVGALGMIPTFLDLLNKEGWPVKSNILRTLENLAEGNEAIQNAIRDAKGISRLTELIKIDNPRSLVILLAIRSIARGNPGNQTEFKGAIPTLVNLLKSSQDILQITAIEALLSLTNNHPDNQEAVRNAGAIETLLGLLSDSKPSLTSRVILLLKDLAENDPKSQDLLRQSPRAETLKGFIGFIFINKEVRNFLRKIFSLEAMDLTLKYLKN